MWPFSSKMRSRLAVFLYDGRTWYGRIFVWRKRNWNCIESVSHLSQSPWELPGELLTAAVNHSVRRVRVLLPNDIYSIQLNLPGDVEPEEVHTALAYEVANETGIDAHMVRLAAVRATHFCMGGAEDLLLATSFELSKLTRYDQACRKEGLVFDGIGSVELAALNCHARREPNSRLLLLRSQNGFYVTPGTETTPFGVQSVPFGIEPLEESSRDEERLARVGRQLKHSKTHVHLWCTQMPSESRKQKLQELFGSDVGFEYIDFADMVTAITTHAAWQGHVGQITCGCAMVAMQKTERPPYRAGTWLFLMILAVAGLYVGLRWHTFQEQLVQNEQKMAAWNALQQERKKASSDVDRLEAIRKYGVAMENLMGEPILPHGLTAILDALVGNMPPYTCIKSIVETQDQHYEIHGTTRYQEGLILLHQALDETLKGYDLIVDPGSVNQVEKAAGQERQFTCRILPVKGQR